MLKVIHWRSVSWDLLVTGTSIYCFILIWFVFSWWGNTLQWKKSQKNTKTQSTTAQIYTYWDWQKKMSSFDSKKYDISPSCWWDYSYDVERYWSWVESTGNGWNPLEKIKCSLCLRNKFQRRFWFGLWLYRWTGRGYKYAQGNSGPLRLCSYYAE